MSHDNRRLSLTIALALLATACADRAPQQHTAVDVSCTASGVREVVERLGERLSRVQLLAPDSIVGRMIRGEYASFVTPDLLDTWIAEPGLAPGREVSSPWPERIEIHSVQEDGPQVCRVEGEVIHITSVQSTQGGAAARVPVTVRVVANDGWRISEYTADATLADATSASPGAADVIRQYYAAINSRDFRRAWESWGNDGAASGQTFDEFAAGFATTESVVVEIGEPGRAEPAAGSRYVEVPVTIRAITSTGETQHFEGTYTLRRSVVDGAPVESRRWHIYSADVSRIR